MASHKLRDLQQTAEDKIKDITKDIRDLKSKVKSYLDEKESMTSEHQDAQKRKAKLELDIKDLQDEVEGDSSAKVGEEINTI